MQINADVHKISKTVQRDLSFILNVLSESRIHFSSTVLAKKMLLVSLKVVFIKSKAALLCVATRDVLVHLQLQPSI